MVTQTLELRKSIFLTAVRIQGPLQRPKKSKNRAKRGSKIQNHILSCQTGSGSVQNSYFGCKSGLLPKRGTQKDISDCKQTLGAQKGQKRAKNRPKKGQKNKNCFLRRQMEFQSVQNAQLDSRTGSLPKKVDQKHIFDSSQTLEAIQRPKKSKNRPKRGSKIQNCIF